MLKAVSMPSSLASNTFLQKPVSVLIAFHHTERFAHRYLINLTSCNHTQKENGTMEKVQNSFCFVTVVDLYKSCIIVQLGHQVIHTSHVAIRNIAINEPH